MAPCLIPCGFYQLKMQFKIFGMQVYISFMFAAYITLLLFIDQTGLIMPVLISNLIHEFGHAWAMNKVRCKIIKLELKPGGCLLTVPPFKTTKDEIFVALCGPIFNFAFCIIFIVVWLMFNIEGCFVAAVINGGLCCFNMLPIKGLDANTVMYCLIAKKHIEIYNLLSTLFLLLFSIVGILFFMAYGINTSVIVVAIYLVCCYVFKI